jgi:hypothetical protein
MIVDCDTRAIKVTWEGKTKVVEIGCVDANAFSSASDALEFERIATLWREIRSLIPNPTALDYRTEDQHALQQWKEGKKAAPLSS